MPEGQGLPPEPGNAKGRPRQAGQVANDHQTPHSRPTISEPLGVVADLSPAELAEAVGVAAACLGVEPWAAALMPPEALREWLAMRS